ncbi:hypothetical protein KDK_30130 [Dictyobacter kobayashii]|uniref:Uncharacterized protein n=1 Tax=Dictyobacter kobayashii TaxID=2014872 RepID=A0A402AJG7_9CHLR|nr:hypothetical protein KDK_30130 [Dictyobacter kobayashii]
MLITGHEVAMVAVDIVCSVGFVAISALPTISYVSPLEEVTIDILNASILSLNFMYFLVYHAFLSKARIVTCKK